MQYIDKTYMFYLSQINKTAMLTRDEEYEQATKARKGNEKARQRLVAANLRFVVQIAKRYSNCGLQVMDLVSEGNLGLIRAVETFNPEKGYHFISYAVHWIKQSIIKAISEKSKIMRIPLHLNNSIAHIETSIKEDHNTVLTQKTVENVSKKLNMNEKDMLKLITVSRGYSSLDKEIGEKDGDRRQLSDMLEDGKTVSPEMKAIDKDLKKEINKLLSTLPETEADVIEHRFGLNGKTPLTLLEIGKKKNVTKERIRQIEKKALETLKGTDTKEKLLDFVVT